NQADERRRERTLSRMEESRLFALCVGRRAHFRVILVCALDTGMRRGEMFSLRWGSVDFSGRAIHIEALNTKTLRSRTVPMTERLHAELLALRGPCEGY